MCVSKVLKENRQREMRERERMEKRKTLISMTNSRVVLKFNIFYNMAVLISQLVKENKINVAK